MSKKTIRKLIKILEQLVEYDKMNGEYFGKK